MEKNNLKYWAALVSPSLLWPILIVIDWELKDKLISLFANAVVCVVKVVIFFVLKALLF